MSGTAAGPTGESSAAARSGISRRHLLVGAGVLGVAAAALPLLRATPAMAINLGHPFLGSNQDVYNEILNGLGGVVGNPVPLPRPLPVPGLNGVRMYGEKPKCDPLTGVCTTVVPPATWPAGPIINVTVNGVWTTAPYSGPMVYSIYPNPMEVSDTTSPTYANLQSLIASAPPHCYLNAWHEAMGLDHPGYITKDSLYALHDALNKMCQNPNINTNNLTYGSIFGNADTWDEVPNNLGYYGYDAYASSDTSAAISTGMDVLNDFIDNAKSHYTSDRSKLWPGTSPNYPNILIGEMNMPPNSSGDTSQRGPWFEAVCGRMHQYGANAVGVLTFWKESGDAPVGGPWLPYDLPTEQAMNDIINNTF